MPADFTIDDRRFQQALRRALEYSKRGPDAILREQARGFVRLITQITPPGSEQVKGMAAKQAGERSIGSDLTRVGYPVTKAKLGPNGITSIEALAARHKNSRSRASGRVLKSTRPVPVASAVFRQYLKAQQARVGLLASGWNAAAAKLGVALPAWVRRHGNARGQIRITSGLGNHSITLTNSVRFARVVRDLERRVQWTLDTRADILERRTLDYLAKLKKHSGF